MLNKLTYKKKNIGLLIVSVLVAFIVYSFGIKKTIAAHTEYAENKNKMEQASSAPAMAEQLEKELIRMDAKIGSRNTRDENVNETLLSLITSYCQSNHAVLREFPQTTVNEDGNLSVETNRFIIGGNFFTLINLVYLLEQKYNLGKVVSVSYQLKKDFKTQEMQLTANVFLQNIKKKQHEN